MVEYLKDMLLYLTTMRGRKTKQETTTNATIKLLANVQGRFAICRFLKGFKCHIIHQWCNCCRPLIWVWGILVGNNVSNVWLQNIKKTANWVRKDLCNYGRVVRCNIINRLQNKQCGTCGCGGYNVDRDQINFPNGTLSD